MGFQVFDERILIYSYADIDNAAASTWNAIQSGLQNGQRVDVLTACSTDTVSRVLAVALGDTAGQILLGSVTVPAGAGTGGIPAVDVLAALIGTVAPGLYIPRDAVLAVRCESTVTSGKDIFVWLQGGSF